MKKEKYENKKCRYAKCEKQIDKNGILTNIGWVCSRKCQIEIQKRVFRALAFPLTSLEESIFDEIDKQNSPRN